MSDEPKRGFACGNNAADAARRNHELGTAHKFTKRTGKKWSRKGVNSPGHPSKRRVIPQH